MSKEEQEPEFEETLELDLDSLEEVTLKEIRANIPKVFMKPSEKKPNVSFDFVLNDIKKVKVIPKQKTRVGIQDMYVLNSVPEIRCFRNALAQLEDFIKDEGIKLPSNLHYETRTGSDYETTYIFEKG